MKSFFKKFLIILFSLIVISIISFFIYCANYYKADKTIIEVLNNKNIEIKDNYIILSSENSSDTGIIFYPGAKIEYTSYLPILNQLKENGYTCILVKMPFNFAFFNPNVADKIIEENTNIKNWYISGHSLGGAMASYYSSKNLYKINGTILLGAYIYGDIPLEKSLVIYGSNDLILNKDKLKNNKNEIIIDGGNHSQFGNYGEQKGDGNATISSETQQTLTIDLIDNFIKSTTNS